MFERNFHGGGVRRERERFKLGWIILISQTEKLHKYQSITIVSQTFEEREREREREREMETKLTWTSLSDISKSGHTNYKSQHWHSQKVKVNG